MGSEQTLAWFRHAELKHGRVAMAAIVGLLVHINGIHFSGSLSPTYGVTFEALSKMGPFEAWNAIPLLGQAQILWTIAGLEHASECLDPAGHYTKGGTPGNLKFLKVRVSRGNRISLFCAHCFIAFALTLYRLLFSLTHTELLGHSWLHQEAHPRAARREACLRAQERAARDDRHRLDQRCDGDPGLGAAAEGRAGLDRPGVRAAVRHLLKRSE